MKYLVLGSSGQIGLALCKYLRKLNHEVLTFDIVDDENEDLRIRNNQLLIDKIKKTDFVFFLAFDVGGSRYLKTYQHSLNFLSNNARLMEFTFEKLAEFKTPFIFASSQMSNMSYSPYGTLKALGEFYSKALNGLIVKFWNVYGEEHDKDKTHVITDFILSAKNNKVINMMTNGEEVRQFLHADDCSECLYVLSKNYATISRDEELHVTNFEWNSILEVANIVAGIYPGTIVNPAKTIDTVQLDKRNEPNNKILDYWTPKMKLADGILQIAKTLNSLE
jgi:nucleoside-diphosphate-sugar epimerase